MPRLLVSGSVNGDFSSFFAKISGMHQKHGPFDVLLVAGQFFGSSERQDQLQLLLSGQIKVPLQTYLINGNGAVPEAITARMQQQGEICENLVYLGPNGVLKTSDGLKIVYISGEFAHSQEHIEEEETSSTKTSYSAHDISLLLKKFDTQAHKANIAQADVLLTWDVPCDVYAHSDVAKKLAADQDVGKRMSTGSKSLSDLALAIKPKYHFSGKDALFCEREPFECNGNVVRYISLGEFAAPDPTQKKSKQKWFYAMNITPISEESSENPPRLPAIPSSLCPLIGTAHVMGQKRSASTMQDESNGSYFWGIAEPAPPQKSQHDQSTHRPPPDSYTCHACDQKGHWIQDCPVRAEKRAQHEARRDSNEHPVKKSRSSACWFCLSNPEIEKHLIAHIEEETYVTLAKGGLNDDHSIIIPMGHFPSINALHHTDASTEESITAQATLAEIEQVKQLFVDAYAPKNMGVVFAETFGGLLSEEFTETIHSHLQAVSVPSDLLEAVYDALKKQAPRDDFVLLDKMYPDDPRLPYIHIDINKSQSLTFVVSNDRLTHFLKNKNKKKQGKFPPRLMNMQFVRYVLADVLGLSDKRDWRKVVKAQDEEAQLTQNIKNLLSSASA